MKSATARVQRDLAVTRVDLAVMRSEVKSLYLLARAEGTDTDERTLRACLDRLDKCIILLNDPSLFHPTLF